MSTAAASSRPVSRPRDGRLDLGCERGRAGPAAEAGAHLGPPQPALLADGLGLVEVARGELHGLDAHAVELLGVILERQRQQLEHVGGFLVSAISWRAIFLVNLPVALAAIALTARFVPESRAPRPRRIDPVGQILVITALASLTYAIIEGGRVGFGTVQVVLVLALALGCFAGLVLYELRRREPLLEVRFFTSAPFAGASAIAVCLSAALGGFLFMNTLYLQDVRGLSPIHAGLYMLPTAAMMIVFAPLSGRLVGRVGARPSMLTGGLAVLAGGLMLTGLAPRTPVPFLLSAYAVFGFGFALVSPPIANTAVSGMPPAQAGVAAAVASTSRQVGIALGVAVLGAVVGGGLGGGDGFAYATRPGWWIVAALGLAVAALGYLTTTRWARDTAHRTAERLEALDPRDRAAALPDTRSAPGPASGRAEADVPLNRGREPGPRSGPRSRERSRRRSASGGDGDHDGAGDDERGAQDPQRRQRLREHDRGEEHGHGRIRRGDRDHLAGLATPEREIERDEATDGGPGRGDRPPCARGESHGALSRRQQDDRDEGVAHCRPQHEVLPLQVSQGQPAGDAERARDQHVEQAP